MQYCPICGSEVGSDSFCWKCGESQKRIHDIRSKKSPVGVVVGVAVILLIVGGIGYLLTENMHSANVTVYVHSTHITQTVDWMVIVDGKEYTYPDYKLRPGGEYYVSYKVTFSLFKEHKVITITANSFGGGLGTQTQSKEILIHNGGNYVVHLYI